MDLEKIAEATHQAWFVAMAKQGWIFGPRLNPDFKTHPWLKPYGGLSDGTKEIVRAQVRGTLAALDAQGYAAKGAAPSAPVARPVPAVPRESSEWSRSAEPAPSASPRRPAGPSEGPVVQQRQPALADAPIAASSAGVKVATAAIEVNAGAVIRDAAAGDDVQILERRTDASGRMRIGSGLVKKAELLPGNATQVAILQQGNVIEVLPYDAHLPEAFFASVNPDGFMLPKAMLAGMGAVDFILTISPGRLVVKPK